MARTATELGLHPTIEHPPNPRVEAEAHHYAPMHDHLAAVGYRRSRELPDVMREIFRDLTRYRRRLEARRHVVQPTVRWASGDSRPDLAARRAARPDPSPEPSAGPPIEGSSA